MTIEFTCLDKPAKRKKSDLLVLPFWKEKKGIKAAADASLMKADVAPLIESGDFKGKEGECALIYLKNGETESRVVLLGLGEKEKENVEHLRRAYSAVAKLAQQKKLTAITIVLPTNTSLKEQDVTKGVVEGLLLSNYLFTLHKNESIREKPPVLLKKVTLVGATAASKAVINDSILISDSVYHARDLINQNADLITPQYLGKFAQQIQKDYANVKTTVFDKKRIEKEGMGLLLAVGRGSSVDPAFIIVEYKGDPKSKDHTVVVGKGVTYDTGGLNLKPTGSMETMRQDMSGAAAALCTVRAAAALKLKRNVTAVVPTTENSISGHSFKPGDVYKSYLGKTVEIGNTDAEGRLILADALAYTVKNLKPSRIVDFATLTGAMVIALGEETTGMMSNDDKLSADLSKAGERTFERVWRLPLHEEYKKKLKSDVADLNNIGGRAAGSITAALFLQEFVGETPWAHMDIAGTAFLSEGRAYLPKNATGTGVRLMIDYLSA